MTFPDGRRPPIGRTIAYCRVSSRDQNPQLQLNVLDVHGYDVLFAEKQSRKRGAERPEFAVAWPRCRPGTRWCSGSLTGEDARPRTC